MIIVTCLKEEKRRAIYGERREGTMISCTYRTERMGCQIKREREKSPLPDYFTKIAFNDGFPFRTYLLMFVAPNLVGYFYNTWSSLCLED